MATLDAKRSFVFVIKKRSGKKKERSAVSRLAKKGARFDFAAAAAAASFFQAKTPRDIRCRYQETISKSATSS